jgi:WD40 repeat protein
MNLKVATVVLAAAFSPDGQLIVTASVDKTARVWCWRRVCARVPSTTHRRPSRRSPLALSRAPLLAFARA